ncbi:MAG: hypothetical protein DKM50_00825 [Candidatus Margulisiibacteriota bacterium]|nr:MAG: hypothetical protein A2X43_05300 [Candidatus Margulisbacteria bacterium GWD2_39_127]OGI01478.1 MAG: hypothetical protein A2X42_11905 [Candidatus Margulisbacteria bacterium GWF2_38_17]OGI10821.1 MAG: hypothetical protein A2X41_10130 [Candidatus Margulisbacteria bacterium GWE2_39_32]PZM83959.1 MAG: hypothetical protein DKM50_00825 [Candidatus Margulisiibacteriota bacterium]HAR64457.1 hypothetical protein [Candidatus Margulisiibacteriota bacterium]
MDQDSFLFKQGKNLEDLFFYDQDQKLIENLKLMEKMKETKETLSQVSGITDDAILERLVQLDIHPQVMASVSIIPLVAVAWADGVVDEKEKKSVLECADNDIFRKNQIDRDLIDSWLTHKPPKKLIDAWISYVHGLCKELDDAQLKYLKEQIMGHCDKIARVSGGFLGIGKISGEESAMIMRLGKAFDVCGI